MKNLINVSLLFLTTIASNASMAQSGRSKGDVHFKVTITNLTVGNAISPYLTVIGKRDFKLFQIGRPATPGIQGVAEMGATAVLEEELAGQAGVISVTKAAGGPFLANQSRTVEFDVSREDLAAGAQFNVIAMIGRSNDSFIFRQVPLAWALRKGSVHAYSTNYDAGTEENTGMVSDFGSGGHPTAKAEGFISFDRGLNPRGDAPDLLTWGERVGSILIEAE